MIQRNKKLVIQRNKISLSQKFRKMDRKLLIAGIECTAHTFGVELTNLVERFI